MNLIKSMQVNVDSIEGVANEDKKLFASILPTIQSLKSELTNEDIDVELVEMLVVKIDDFYKKYLPSSHSVPGVIYSSPNSISDTKGSVKDLVSTVNHLKVQHVANGSVSGFPDKKQTIAKYNISDQKLFNSCKSDLESGNGWDAVYKATRHLETRIRGKANLSSNDIGTTLVDKAFSPNNNQGTLKLPVCETISEEQGIYFLLKGVVQFHRNVKGHREGEIDFGQALHIIGYVDYLLSIIETAVVRNKC